MGRYLGPTCKICRREGESLCSSQKCAYIKRKYPPGVHGPKGYPRLSVYAQQLREKQKAKRIYNINEKQFRRYFDNALKSKFATGEDLLRGLETRLDNVVFRIGLASTRRQSRQMVSHGFITVNGKKIDIPSYVVRIGDLITIKENKKKTKLFKEIKERKKEVNVSWIHFTAVDLKAKITSLPQKEDCPEKINDKLILEFYSR